MATIENKDIDPNCKVFGKIVELVVQLASAYSIIAHREYKKRHDRIGLRVYF